MKQTEGVRQSARGNKALARELNKYTFRYRESFIGLLVIWLAEALNLTDTLTIQKAG
jgi:hypothetical protein